MGQASLFALFALWTFPFFSFSAEARWKCPHENTGLEVHLGWTVMRRDDVTWASGSQIAFVLVGGAGGGGCHFSGPSSRGAQAGNSVTNLSDPEVCPAPI